MEQEIPQQLYVQLFVLIKSPRFACFTVVAFVFCSYSLEVLDYQDFQIIGCWIKGILLYNLKLPIEMLNLLFDAGGTAASRKVVLKVLG